MIRRARPEDMADCLEIRRVVFIVEQDVPEDVERDGRDGEAVHLIAFAGNEPVGTARVLITDDTGKIGRVAVLATHRGTGLGKGLINATLHELKLLGVAKAKLGAQTHALGFYEALGFTAEGHEFMDAGIPHRMMVRAV